MTITAVELLGLVKPKPRARRRVVALAETNPDEIRKAKRKAAIGRKNARALANLKKDQARLEARKKYLRDWEEKNALSRRSYRAAWRMRNEELYKHLQRQSARKRYKPKGGARKGEAHYEAKLDADKVRAIRRRHAAGGVSMKALAADYGISPTSVSQVIRRETWAHVKDEA